MIDEFVSVENAGRLIAGFDIVLDCIDQVGAKAALIAAARAMPASRSISCGAAGGRVDPLRIASGDLARITGDPLLAKVRQRLRRDYGFPKNDARRPRKFEVTAIYSDEPVRSARVRCTARKRRTGLLGLRFERRGHRDDGICCGFRGD